MRLPATVCLSVCVSVFAAIGQLQAQCSAFGNAPPGTNLRLQEEGLHRVQLGFPFRFDNVVYDRITICDDGYVWLGNPPASAASDFSPTAGEMLSQPPRLCVCWDDLHSDSVLVPSNGGVFFRTDGNTANVVWKGIPRFFHQPVFANMELVLTSDTHPTNRNEIAFVYDASMMPMTGQNIVGISRGNGAAAPPATQPPGAAWTAFAPGIAFGATAYQVFTGSAGATPFNLVGQTLRFAPTVPGAAVDFSVTIAPLGACAPLPSYPPVASQPLAYGTGCPNPVPPGSLYETFTVNSGTQPFDLANQSIMFVRNGGAYVAIQGVPLDPTFASTGTLLTGGDDITTTLSLGAMGTFAFGTATMTNVVACSNGFLWLPTPTGTGTSFTPTAAAFNGELARIAPCWTDLNSSTTGGGTWYWENGNPQFCRLTWAAVREFGQAASANTFQVTLFANGDIAFSYGAMSGGIAHAILVGISGGGVTVDPGPFDFVTAGTNNVVVRNISAVQTMVHTLAGPCQLGLDFTLSSTVPAPWSGVGFFVIGYANPAVPLDGLGGAGCTLYATLDNLFTVLFAASPLQTTLTVPATPALAGAPLFSQAAALSTLNALGIIASNGQAFTVGI